MKFVIPPLVLILFQAFLFGQLFFKQRTSGFRSRFSHHQNASNWFLSSSLSFEFIDQAEGQSLPDRTHSVPSLAVIIDDTRACYCVHLSLHLPFLCLCPVLLNLWAFHPERISFTSSIHSNNKSQVVSIVRVVAEPWNGGFVLVCPKHSKYLPWLIYRVCSKHLTKQRSLLIFKSFSLTKKNPQNQFCIYFKGSDCQVF